MTNSQSITIDHNQQNIGHKHSQQTHTWLHWVSIELWLNNVTDKKTTHPSSLQLDQKIHLVHPKKVQIHLSFTLQYNKNAKMYNNLLNPPFISATSALNLKSDIVRIPLSSSSRFFGFKLRW